MTGQLSLRIACPRLAGTVGYARTKKPLAEANDSHAEKRRPEACQAEKLTDEITKTGSPEQTCPRNFDEMAHRIEECERLHPCGHGVDGGHKSRQQRCSTCDGSGEGGPFQCWNCGGTGSALNEFPFEVEYPPGIQDFYSISIPLDRYGISGLCPILLFRISGEGDFEECF